MHNVYFFKTLAGNEPARDFLQELPKEDRLTVGTDLKTVQLGFPIGMPVCRPLGDKLYEVRSSLASKREARLFFFIDGDAIIVVHGIIKKSQKTPKFEIDSARSRKSEYERAKQMERQRKT